MKQPIHRPFQAPLPLGEPPPRFLKENFCISDCNAEAFSWVEQWPRWPGGCLVIYGPPGCGKTHLGQIWAQAATALTLEKKDYQSRTPWEWVQYNPHILIDTVCGFEDELFLLQLYNLIQERRGSLLLLAKTPPARFKIILPDLRSRLNSAPCIPITSPDLTVLQKMMLKMFSDLHLYIAPDIVAYVLRRIERSFETAQRFVSILNTESLSSQEAPSLGFVKKICKDFSFFSSENEF